MPEENRQMLRYRILRYTPNLVRDEWVNIGILLEDVNGPRRAVKLIEENSEIARVRRLHPAADESLLRALPLEMESRLVAPDSQARLYIEKLGDTLSNVLQFSPTRALIAEDFNAEIERLYHDHVAPPPGVRGIVENTRGWIRNRLHDLFRRKRMSDKIHPGIRVEEFTQPGDPMKLDYGYRYNGTHGYIHAIALGRDPSQAKVLAYTAEAIRARFANSVFTAITEVEPAAENTRHRFVARLLEEQRISIVPLNRVERFAEDLRPRLQ